MRKRQGRINGQMGLIIMSAALILFASAGLIAVGLTYTRIREVGKEIKAIEADQRKLKEANRFLAEKLARATDAISLKESVMERLQPPTPDQVVLVRRRATPVPVLMRTIPRDPKFAALDIAFIQNTPVNGSATVR